MAMINFPTRIAHATDDQESARYALRGTLVTPEGFAFATDGHLAACVKVQAEGLETPAMVPQELGPASKTDLKAEYHTNSELKCEKHSIVKGQRRVEQADVRDGRFPRAGDILCGIDATKHLLLAVNANYLWRLAQAINVPDTPAADVVILFIPKPDETGVVKEVVGVLSNYDSRHGEDAGGFGMVMPCDVEADEARADFKRLRDDANASLDAAAKKWSDMCVARWKKEEEAAAAAERAAKEAMQAASAVAPPAQPKPRRKASRKRSVA